MGAESIEHMGAHKYAIRDGRIMKARCLGCTDGASVQRSCAERKDIDEASSINAPDGIAEYMQKDGHANSK